MIQRTKYIVIHFLLEEKDYMTELIVIGPLCTHWDLLQHIDDVLWTSLARRQLRNDVTSLCF